RASCKRAWALTIGRSPPLLQAVLSDVVCVAHFRRTPPVVEAHDLLRTPLQVGDDEADAGEQLARVPLHLDYHAAGTLPRPGPVAEAVVEDLRLARRPAHGPLQQRGDLSLQHGVGLDPDGVAEGFLLQQAQQFRPANAASPRKNLGMSRSR